MAIIRQIIDSNPYIYQRGGATRTKAVSLPSIPTEETNDVSLCSLGFDYEEKVFALPGGAWYKNDKSSFLFQKLITSDTITFSIYKDGALVASITDQTYGEWYDFGTLGNSLYTGFVVYWENVHSAFGAGIYKIKAEKNILGVTSTFTSRQFRLLRYTDLLADNTIRLESYQTGNIISSQFDYNDLLPNGWYQSYRVNGRLFAPDIKTIIDRILNEDYEQIQVVEQITNEWKLLAKQLPAIITNPLIYDNSLANKFLVTDYNLYNHEIYRRKELYVTSIEKLSEPNMNVNRSYKLTLLDKIENKIKRNY